MSILKKAQVLQFKSQSISIYLLFVCLIVAIIVYNQLEVIFYSIPLTIIFVILLVSWNQANQIFKCIFYFILFLITIILLNATIEFNGQKKLQYLYNLHQFKNQSNPIENNQQKFDNSYNIFFIETNHQRKTFNRKQLCAVESAASNNQNANVYVLSISSDLGNDLAHLEVEYKNVYMMKFMPFDLFSNTPLWQWWLNGKVFKSDYLMAHISDAARLALLWKYGGVYSDLDTISVKSFKNLLKNSGVGYLYENRDSIGNGFLVFTKKHPFLKYVMQTFADQYDPNNWGKNGPSLILESMKKYCKTDNVFDYLKLEENHLKKQINCDLVIFPQDYFYPYGWYKRDLNKLFEKNSSLNISALIEAYSVHFYGKFSDRFEIKISDFSLYEYLASVNCEIVYEHVKKKIPIFNVNNKLKLSNLFLLYK